MEEQPKLRSFTIGYQSKKDHWRALYLMIFLLFFIIFVLPPVQSIQTNCSNYVTPIEFNYTLEARNLSTSGTIVDSAICNITVSPYINNSLMLRKGGEYYCPIALDFPAGKYETNMTCNQGNIVGFMKGNFEVIENTSPFAIITFLSFVTLFFLSYTIFLDKNHDVLKKFFFLMSLLMLSVIFYVSRIIIGEEEGVSNVISSQFNSIYIGYTSVFIFIFFYIIIRWIFASVDSLRDSKQEERMN